MKDDVQLCHVQFRPAWRWCLVSGTVCVRVLWLHVSRNKHLPARVGLSRLHPANMRADSTAERKTASESEEEQSDERAVLRLCEMRVCNRANWSRGRGPDGPPAAARCLAGRGITEPRHGDVHLSRLSRYCPLPQSRGIYRIRFHRSGSIMVNISRPFCVPNHFHHCLMMPIPFLDLSDFSPIAQYAFSVKTNTTLQSCFWWFFYKYCSSCFDCWNVKWTSGYPQLGTNDFPPPKKFKDNF